MLAVHLCLPVCVATFPVSLFMFKKLRAVFLEDTGLVKLYAEVDYEI